MNVKYRNIRLFSLVGIGTWLGLLIRLSGLVLAQTTVRKTGRAAGKCQPYPIGHIEGDGSVVTAVAPRSQPDHAVQYLRRHPGLHF